MNEILLLRPPELYGNSSFAQFYTLHECLGIGYLASYLRSHHHSVHILDAHIDALTVEETIESINKQDCSILGISIGSSLVMPQVQQIIHAIKTTHPKVHITLGGHYPTFSYSHLLEKYPEIDSIVRYEGEETLLELAQALEANANLADVKGIAYRKNGRVAATPIRPLIAKLDNLPFPARDTLPKLLERGGLPLISGSRGCPSRCSFCSVHSFYNTPPGKIWRARSIENIIEEIKFLEKNFDCHELWFVDDNFIGSGKSGEKRARDFFVTLNAEKVTINRLDFLCRADSLTNNPALLKLAYGKRRGAVYPGIEAGVQRILDLYQKGTTVEQNRTAVKAIKESHADLRMEFILFNPWITFDEVKESIRFLEEIDAFDPYVLTSVLTIMRHTQLADAIQKGRLEIMPMASQSIHEFNQDSFIPYRITDEKVMILFQLVTDALPQLENVMSAVHDMRLQGLKRLKGSGSEPALLSLEERCENITNLINVTAMDIFKDAMEWVENMGGTGDSDKIQIFQTTLTQKTLQYACSLRGFIEILKKEPIGVIE